MASNKQKAEQLIAEANRKLFPGSGLMTKVLSVFSSGSQSHIEDAIELYVRAGNILKMEKEWSEAGKIFNKIADLHLEIGNRHDAATKYSDASSCFKKCNPVEAINCLLKAINIYTDMGRFSVAAKHHIMVAEIYEGEDGDIPKAVEHYSKAADYYQCEESNTSANRCLLNVARYAAQLEQYEKAIQIYESIGQSSLDNNMLKYGAKEHFLRAGLCHLCVDTLNAQIAIKRYEEMSPAFADSRECKLLKDISSKIEARDVDGFAQVVQDYDSISRFDSWYTTLLLRIKNQIVPEDDLK
uniref:Soluble NSF attachment protein n=1 Tax=Aceria tosichella TaxID=561515 RepID=A0A6G1SIM9_9ACAR